MLYSKTTFQNDLSPAINATWLNATGTIIQSLAANAINRATIVSGSTSSNYKIAVTGYSSVPTSGEIPFIVLMTPTATNVSPCTITPSWGSTSYTVKDPKRNANIQAGEIINGVPCFFIFDGTYFWYLASKGLVAGTDYVVPMAALTALPTSGTALQDNTNYIVSSTVGTYAFVWPSGTYHVHLVFTTSSSPNITFPSGTKYANSTPSFSASTQYEMDVENGIVVLAEVVSA